LTFFEIVLTFFFCLQTSQNSFPSPTTTRTKTKTRFPFHPHHQHQEFNNNRIISKPVHLHPITVIQIELTFDRQNVIVAREAKKMAMDVKEDLQENRIARTTVTTITVKGTTTAPEIETVQETGRDREHRREEMKRHRDIRRQETSTGNVREVTKVRCSIE
jgi:hypothetical protein